MIIVSNTSPLIALDHLGELDLLQRVFSGAILIPPAVAQELEPRQRPPWLEIRGLAQPIGPTILQASLGVGEREAIALSLETKCDLVLLDDKAARRVARLLQVPLLGTLGVLLKAKQANLIPELRPKLEALRTLPFHIAPALRRYFLIPVNIHNTPDGCDRASGGIRRNWSAHRAFRDPHPCPATGL